MKLKWYGFSASAIVAGECAHRASGIAPQYMFADGLSWLWWIAVLGWAVIAIRFVLQPE